MAKNLQYDFSKNFSEKWTMAAVGPNCIFFTDYEERKQAILEAKRKAQEVASKTTTQEALPNYGKILPTPKRKNVYANTATPKRKSPPDYSYVTPSAVRI